MHKILNVWDIFQSLLAATQHDIHTTAMKQDRLKRRLFDPYERQQRQDARPTRVSLDAPDAPNGDAARASGFMGIITSIWGKIRPEQQPQMQRRNTLDMEEGRRLEEVRDVPQEAVQEEEMDQEVDVNVEVDELEPPKFQVSTEGGGRGRMATKRVFGWRWEVDGGCSHV